MTEIPLTWLSFCEDCPPKGRWDQMFLERIFNGEEWVVPNRYHFTEDADDRQAGIHIFPASHYVEHDEVEMAIDGLEHLLAVSPWALIIATCDEASLFPWHLVKGFDDRHRLWLQTPQTHHLYPPDTRFIPIGSHTPPSRFARLARTDWKKDADLFFSGQVTHERRERMWEALQKIKSEQPDLNIKINATDAFASGLEESVYLREMVDAKIVPCPSGIVSEDSFRLYEALEAQAVPFLDRYRGDGDWAEYLFLESADCPLGVFDWPDLQFGGMQGWEREAAAASAWWQQYKRDLVWDLHRTVSQLRQDSWAGSDSHFRQITVIIPTSPMPSNPDIDILEETIQSVKDRLPDVEIIVMIDGVRDEQADREADYVEYARRVCARYAADPHVVPIFHEAHMHQSGMTRHVLDHVHTEYLMFVEHDTPLVGDIDFGKVVETMHADDINMMRFHHDVAVHETSAHLYMETEPPEGQPYLRTVQWSQRPHVARTSFYRHIISLYFGADSRTMIEDVMHGTVQHLHNGSKKRVLRGWEAWRLAVWAPEMWNLKRSGHLDGRAGDPKYKMYVAYDGERPEGAPPEGWM